MSGCERSCRPRHLRALPHVSTRQPPAAGRGRPLPATLVDFPPESTEPYGVEVLTSDQFLLELLDASPATVIRTLGRQAERYKRDPKTLDGLLTSLSRAGVRNFADEVRRLIP